ncbi:SPAG4 protein, partial [Jacana jacana]|nr:SPAG4 protein [Jacana jacana]
GYCWPFQGSQSEVLMRLPAQILPIAISIRHASMTAFPLGTASSAPRDFTVYVSLCGMLGPRTWPRGKGGLDEEGKEEALLGTFSYDVQKQPMQTFPLQNEVPRAFRFLKLGIQSNWGKPGYTCICQVQVHGK